MEKNSYDDVSHSLLGEGHDFDHDTKSSKRGWMQRNWLGLAILSLLTYNAVVLTSQVLLGLATKKIPGVSVDHDTQPGILPKERIQYELRPEWSEPVYPWNLPPSDELEQTWNNLLHAINIRVSPSELHALGMNKTNRVRVEGGDYLGVLGVYHQLHCLNNLRRVIHWDYYGPRFAKAKSHWDRKGFSKEHSDHCIDSLRQALLCHPNTDLYTVEYIDDPDYPIGTDLKSRAVTKCVNWEVMNGWARKRALVRGEFLYLPGPYKSFPKQKGQTA